MRGTVTPAPITADLVKPAADPRADYRRLSPTKSPRQLACSPITADRAAPSLRRAPITADSSAQAIQPSADYRRPDRRLSPTAEVARGFRNRPDQQIRNPFQGLLRRGLSGGARLVVGFCHSEPCLPGVLVEHSGSAQAMSCQRPLRLLTTAQAARLARQTSSAPRRTRHRTWRGF